MPLARADDRVERRHRAARREESARRGRKIHPRAQPVERVRFELHERRGGEPDAGEPIGRVGDEVGERRRIDAATGNVRKIARPNRGQRPGNPVAEQLVEQRLQRDALFGRRLAQRAAERAGVDVAAAWLLVDGGDVVDAALDHGVGHRAHLFNRELERHFLLCGGAPPPPPVPSHHLPMLVGPHSLSLSLRARSGRGRSPLGLDCNDFPLSR